MTDGHMPATITDHLWPPQLTALPGRSSTSLVIPARNEARNLPHVLEHVPDCIDEVILVDGSSSDVTTKIASSCRPDIRIIDEPRRGKGVALRRGFEVATGELIIAMDADGSMSPEEIPQYVYFLDHGFDFVKGSRFVGGGGSLDLTPFRRMGNRGLLAVANVLFSAHITDLCYGFFGFRAKYLDSLALHSCGFEIETEITVRACQCGLRMAEVPSLELPRRHGGSNLHAIRDGRRVLSTLVQERYPGAAAHRAVSQLLGAPLAESSEPEVRFALPPARPVLKR